MKNTCGSTRSFVSTVIYVKKFACSMDWTGMTSSQPNNLCERKKHWRIAKSTSAIDVNTNFISGHLSQRLKSQSAHSADELHNHNAYYETTIKKLLFRNDT